MTEEQGKQSGEETGPLGAIIAVFGLPVAVVWLFWSNFYIHYLEGYMVNMMLFAFFLPYMLPYLNVSLFASLYVLFQLILYSSSRELMILLWYSGLAVAAILLLIADIMQITLRKVGGRPLISAALGAIGIIFTILMFIDPKIAFYTFIARIPIYIIAAILTSKKP